MKLSTRTTLDLAHRKRPYRSEIPGNMLIETDLVDEELWEGYLDLFEDASIYQSWAYGKYFPGGRKISHVVLKEKGSVMALAGVRILTLPFLHRGIAYVFFGPVWKKKGFAWDKKVLEGILKALNNEYAIKRKLMLRLVPGMSIEEERQFEEVFRNSFYVKNDSYKPQRTIILGLEPTIPEIRSRFHHKWRNRLNVAERNELQVFEGTGSDLFLKFKGLYRELLLMKDIPAAADIDTFIEIQKNLPERHKMRILICSSQGRAVAGLVGSLIGNRGICLLAAANKEGRELLGAYLLQWELIKWMKENGALEYDLGGIDPENNPGGYRFKAGMGGKEVLFSGQYESCWSISSRIIVNAGEYLRKKKF
ncbi:MAG: GNAT family N-acetyltransferase [Ignavibacteria bacterium]|jgi:hypothetical protein|nr:GNAT family N-acetyltransferase [Ignavibacteria bacterium]MCU7502354.1 GNAT family N-acetyltransferase [Ignavibacteria bacterium]MCU7515081.1 GNAT family N-acetyltransferase [Ignavibacteria bacterium]